MATTTAPPTLDRIAHVVNIPHLDAYCEAAHERDDVVSYGRLIDALAANIVRRKSKRFPDAFQYSWRRTAPKETGDARTWFIMNQHERPGGEYLSVGSLLMLRWEIGADEYLLWENTFALLKEVVR